MTMTDTTHDLTAAIRRVDARRTRSRQKKIGASDVGTCRRRTGYKLAGTKPTNAETGLQAAMGTMLHKGVLAVLRQEYGALTEVRLDSDMVRGHTDALYWYPPEQVLRYGGTGVWFSSLRPIDVQRLQMRAALIAAGEDPDSATVEDVKTKGLYAYQQVEDAGPRLSEWFQVHIYAWLLRTGQTVDPRRGYPTGVKVPVDTVRLRFLNRDNGQSFPREAPYDPAITAEALGWIAEVLEQLEAGGPENVTRDGYGPSTSIICKSCPFLDACWGPQPLGPEGFTRESEVIREDADVELALMEYDRGRALERDGKQIKDRSRAALDAAAPGIYGDNQLSWKRSDAKYVLDADQALIMLEEAGLEPPMKWKDPSRSISVRPRPVATQPAAQKKKPARKPVTETTETSGG